MFPATLSIEKYTRDLSNVDTSLIQKDVDRAVADLELHPTRRKEIFNLLALTCNDKALIDPQWALLAGRLLMDVIHTEVPSTFGKATEKMEPILNVDYFQFVMKNKTALEAMLIPENDFTFDCFAVSTLRKSYLAHLKVDDQSLLMECPQYMYLRVATYLHYPDMNAIRSTYISLSNGYYSQATPTLFNSGMLRPQLSSCFLSSVSDDMRGITKAWHDQAVISKNSGGLGCDYSNIRHSEIGQHGFSRGLTPWLKISNEILKTVDQCFGPDTIVYSSKGPKRIEDILPGDKLVRENGTFGRVAKLLEYPVGDDVVLHSFKIQHSVEPVAVASCHPMLAFKYPSGSGSYKIIRDRLDQGKIVPEYIDVGDLDKDYFVATPIPTYEKDIPHISLEDCRMYGIFLGDGYINKKRNEYKVYLNDKSKKETCEFVKEYLQNRNIQFWTFEDKGCKSYGWAPSPKTFPFTRKMLYTKNGDKRICSTMLNLPVEKCLQIFKGVMETDGCYRTGGEIQIEQSSRHLADGIRFILLKAGIPTSGNVRDRVGNISILKRGDQITTQKITYNLRIPKTDIICDLLDRDNPSAKLSYFVYDNKIWSRVTTNEILKVDAVNTPTHIYDIEMENPDNLEENANYLTSVGLAHNGGKRKGSGTIYVRDWHVDVYEFIELRDEGPEDMRAKDLFLALMVSDIFMKRVRDDGKWSLFCPNKAKGLTEVWGDKFEQLYLKYESEGVAARTVNARDLWSHILNMQIKKGMPFLLYMDACNSKSNQQHTGIVRCSNLCCEITLNTGPDNLGNEEIASCTLSSVAIGKCVKSDDEGKSYFDFDMLERLTAEVVRNLNMVIDRNYYPEDIPEIRYSNMRHRPLGIGVQGYADAVALLDMAWVQPNPSFDVEKDQPESKYVVSSALKEFNAQVFETMYYAAIRESIELAKVFGPYKTFEGSPASKGKFQFDMWGWSPSDNGATLSRYGGERWNNLRCDMKRFGLRNSTLLSIMPTASSAHILGNQEACEPFTELIYARTVLSGQFMLVNKHLVRDLKEIGMWTDDTIKTIISTRSLENIKAVSEEKASRLEYIKMKYLTVFEIPQKAILQLGADRGKFICQTESRNCFMARPTRTKLNAYHFYAWAAGLKTGMYYLRQRSLADPINFSADTKIIPTGKKFSKVVCTDEVCLSCNA